jgi:hypothetical protein
MTRDEYKKLLLDKGFIFEKTQTAYPSSRGEEDKYIHPDYKYKFYVSRVSLDPRVTTITLVETSPTV